MDEKENSQGTSEDNTMSLEHQMGTVVKNIYLSCDPDNTDAVPVSKLIEFVKPYLLEDLRALESLKNLLDPDNVDKSISSTLFYKIMDEWSKKIAVCSDVDAHQFNTNPKDLDHIDDKDLPYIQSTPRQSFGQKLVNCKGLLNLSNMSSYNFSTIGGGDATVLEDEVKKLEHQLSKISDELMLAKVQLTAAEEQNETLQADLERVNKRLHAETHINELLQRDKSYSEVLSEELNSYKSKIEDLNRKLFIQEKDCEYAKEMLTQSEQEKVLLEKKCENFSRKEQELKKEIIDMKAGLEAKDQEVAVLIKMNDEMKVKLREHKDLVDQHTNEKEILLHEKETMEKTLKDLASERKKSLLVQFKNDLNDSLVGPRIGRRSTEHIIFSPPSQLNKILKTAAGDTSSHALLQQLLYKRCVVNNQLNSSTAQSLSADSPKTAEFVHDQSSEEDLFWKYQEHLKTDVEQDHESLLTEICNAESISSSNYSLMLFEKEERMLEILEEHKLCSDVITGLNAKVDSLTEQNKSLEETLEKLRKENSENGEKLRDSLMNLVSDKILATSAQVEQHLETKNVMIRELVNINKQLEGQVHVMEHNLQAKIKEVIQTKEQIQRDIDVQNGLWRNMQRLRAEVQNLNREKEELMEGKNTLTEQYGRQLETFESEINQKKVVIESLQSEISNIKTELTSLGKENAKLKEDGKESSKYRGLYQKLSEELDALSTERDDLIKQMEVLKQQSTYLPKSKVSQRNIPLKSYDKQQFTISKLREKIEFLEEKLKADKELKKEKDECEQNLIKTLRENIKKQTSIEMLEKQLELLRTEYCEQDKKLQNAFLEIMEKDDKIQDLNQEIEEIKLEIKQNEHLVQDLSDKSLQKEEDLLNSIQSLKTEVKEKDSQLEDLRSKMKEIQEYENKIKNLEGEIKIYRENQSDDIKERELQHLQNKITAARTTLNSTKEDLILAKCNIDECKKEFIHISKDINKIRNVVISGSSQLKKITLEVFDSCKKLVNINQDDKIRSLSIEIEQNQKNQLSTTNVEDDLDVFNKQVKIVITLMEYTAFKLLKPMDAINNSNEYLSGEGKTLNRFTLRAPKLLLSRPASPDSPSVEINVNTDACSRDIFECVQKDCRSAPSECKLKKTETNVSLTKFEDQIFSFTFSTMTDELLEKVECSNKEQLEKGKSEVLLNDIVTNLTLNAVEIRQRLTKQRELCLDEYEKYLTLLRDISNRLRDHICIGASEPIVPVFVLIEELKLKLVDLLNGVGQCGILTYESRMANCWNLVADYLRVLKEQNESLKQKDISYFGITFRKRNTSKPGEIRNVSTSGAASKVDLSKRRGRRSWLPKPMSIFLLLIVSIIAVLLVHAYCKLTSTSNQICPLDPFIVTTHLGIPPF